MIRTILDTDIGTDVDSCLALGVLLGSPEIDLMGVTCVHGDVDLRPRMVDELFRLAGRSDVPIHLGAPAPLLGLQPSSWPSHEGVGNLVDAPTTPEFDTKQAVACLPLSILTD